MQLLYPNIAFLYWGLEMTMGDKQVREGNRLRYWCDKKLKKVVFQCGAGGIGIELGQ